jgi:uncharacterized protein (DUF1786 family)
LIDIGAGTLDVLYFDDDSGIHYKAVCRSPVIDIARQIEATPGKLLVTGCEMGGGPVSAALKKRARTEEVIMSTSAAATINHDMDKVRAAGIDVISDKDAENLKGKTGFHTITLADLQIDRLKTLVRGFGVPFSFDALGVCAQDHGVPPKGVSHLDFRHNLFKEALSKNPYPHMLLYQNGEIPPAMNRLNSIAQTAEAFSAGEVFVMDSGMAAILGASMDFRTANRQNIFVLDIATSHTVGACLGTGELFGFFEYHTRDITLERLETLVVDLVDGRLDHSTILSEGGHGAYSRHTVGFDAIEVVIATGPKRRLVKPSKLDITPGAPLGDNMMTGTVGLLEAIRRRHRLEPVQYY